MGLKRLLLELIVALMLARFAMLVGDAYAADGGCARGLPALAGESIVLEYDSNGCIAAPGVDTLNGGTDGKRR